MSQQVFADRIGKSKSWVEKVERGVGTLDKFSVIQDIAEVLRVDPESLLSRDASQPAEADGVDALRAALARYDIFRTRADSRPTPSVDDVTRRVWHAWTTYQHAHYPQLLRALPGLLDDTQGVHAERPEQATNLLVQVYRVVASAMVKLGHADLGWLAADRGLAVAARDPLLAATAAVQLGEAVRALGRSRLALSATIAAAHRIAPPVYREGPPSELVVCGTLLLQAALAAAGCCDSRSAEELIDQAADIAEQVRGGAVHYQTTFGPTVVDLTRVVATAGLGDPGEAVARHQKVSRQEQWRHLPAEYRAAYLIDAARAYLQAGDRAAAGRVLIEADRTAPAEIRSRPVARTVITELVRSGPVPTGVGHDYLMSIGQADRVAVHGPAHDGGRADTASLARGSGVPQLTPEHDR